MTFSRRSLICSVVGGAGAVRLGSQKTVQSSGTTARLTSGISLGTASVPSVQDAVDQYCRWFDYVVHWRGKVTTAQAALWEAPGMAGCASAVVGPKNVERGLIRFVENRTKPARAFTTRGWAALEIRTRNVDELARHLAGSPFERIGGPADLKFTAQPRTLRAVQFRGPGEVAMYCTQSLVDPNGAYPGGQLDASNVGTVFIMVLACWPYPATRDFYVRTLRMDAGRESPRPLKFANEFLGWPADRNGVLATARCGPSTLIELDGYPEEVPSRVSHGSLPTGVAMCTLETADILRAAAVLQEAAVPFRRLDAKLSAPPYRNGSALACKGPSGEIVELVETAAI